jgi:hypothetical protein
MTKKFLVLCVLCCFVSSTLYAQTMSFEDHASAVQAEGTGIKEKLDALIAQLDRGGSITPGDLQTILSQIQGIDTEVNDMSGYLTQALSADNASNCQIIRVISLAWAAIGALSATSLLSTIVRLAIFQSTPGIFPARHQRKLVRLYVKCARKVLVASVIIPVSAINILLASRQYQGCLNTDL